MKRRTATWVIERIMRNPLTPVVVDDHTAQARRRGVRRTVAILVVVVAVFYLIAFMQIIMAK